MITPKKWDQLHQKMKALKILENDLEESFILGSGNGGQKLHKTESCVFIKHKPTGIQVKCQESRLRDSNRYLARKRMCEKIEFMLHRKKSQKQQEIEKIRRQKKKRTKRAKQKILDEKHKQSDQKKLRRKPNID